MNKPIHTKTKPIYLPMRGFVTVCTPHALDQTLARTHKGLVQFLDECKLNLQHVFHECTPETCHWIPVGIYLLYVKRKYNRTRRRNELEIISLTPNAHKRTKNRDFAKAVDDKSSDESDSAFPSWFSGD